MPNNIMPRCVSRDEVLSYIVVQMALIYIVIKARKPEKNPDKNVKSP